MMFEDFPLDNWKYVKTSRDCDLFFKKSDVVCFRVRTEMDFPPELVMFYCKDISKRYAWDDGYEHLELVREYKMNTAILHVILKAQWPVGAREALLVFQGIIFPEGSIYLGSKSVEHPEFPIDHSGKLVRI